MRAYMPKDKGRARKSLSFDKQIDRAADAIRSSSSDARKGLSDALNLRSTKKNITPAKRQGYKDAAQALSGPPSLKKK
jgi:hypothetical protein